jgi:hypothetical protein
MGILAGWVKSRGDLGATGNADPAHTGGFSGADARFSIFENETEPGGDAHSLSGEEKHIGGRFSLGDVLGGDHDVVGK